MTRNMPSKHSVQTCLQNVALQMRKISIFALKVSVEAKISFRTLI